MNRKKNLENEKSESRQKEIENIANDVIDELERRVTPRQRFLLFIKNYSIELFSAVLIGLLITIMASIFPKYFPGYDSSEENVVFVSQQPSVESSQNTYRKFHIRAMLSNVFSELNVIKMYFSEYIMATGKLPKDISDLGVSIKELDESKYITKGFLTKESGIGVILSDEFGERKILAIIPELSASGSRILWTCQTNIEQKYLGIPAVAVCQHNASITDE